MLEFGSFIPSKTSVSTVVFIAKLRPSIAMMKRKGERERGSPCQTPFDITNSVVGLPLMITDALHDSGQFRFDQTSFLGKALVA